MMFQWLQKAKDRTSLNPHRDGLLNDGLHLAMEWGSDWLKPIQERLTKKYPRLSTIELDEINTVCQAAMSFGHATVYDLVKEHGRDVSLQQFEPIMKSRYPWVGAGNMSRLFSQGMYYSMK